jgi:hypothetical protein
MTPCWTEVNAAVMAVLAEFGRSRRAADRGTRGPSDGHVFVDRLFSLRHAEALGDGRAEVRLAAGTVVTPLARDFLKRQRVAIRVVSAREADGFRARAAGEWGFAIESRSGQAEAIRRALLDDWAEVGPDAVAAAHWVVDGQGRGALVVADEASVASWRSGRVEGIRASTVTEPEAVTRSVRHLGANLIVVEPAGKSIYLLRQLAERFRRGGAPVAPEWSQSDQQPVFRAGGTR